MPELAGENMRMSKYINIEIINTSCERFTYLKNRFDETVLFKLIFNWKKQFSVGNEKFLVIHII